MDKEYPQAFPSGLEGYSGMSLRDYFAAQAMHAFLREPNAKKCYSNEEVANDAYSMADAMLKARKKK